MNCSACKKALNSKEVMKCRLCISKYHRECLNIDKKQFLAYTKEQTTNWLCPICNNITRRPRSNDSTPVRQSSLLPRTDDPMNMSCDISDHSTSTQSHFSVEGSSSTVTNFNNNTEDPVTMDKISTLLDEKLSASLSIFMDSFRKALRDDVKEMVKSEMESVVKSIKDDFSTTTDYICAEQTSLRTDIKKNADTIKQLECENIKLQAEIVSLNARLVGIDKMSRNCNIELQAVPERKTENVLQLLKKLCDVIKAPIEDGHISACRRVAKHNPNSNRPRNIIVSFTTPRIRDQVLSAVHRYNKVHAGRGLRSSDLDIPGEPCKIFASEHLSPEQKNLHAATRQAAREHNYKYVWIRYGQIYARKDDTAGALLIKNLDSLSKMR